VLHSLTKGWKIATSEGQISGPNVKNLADERGDTSRSCESFWARGASVENE
jgi:hypothetical protein